MDLEPQVVVVGSGFGGAVVACRLSQAGFRVLVLERGRRFAAGDFPALPRAPQLLPDLQRWSWQANRGLWDLQDLDELVSVQAAGYGGGSLLYANVHLRPPADVFDEEWPKVFRGRASLDPFFDLAAYMLNVSPVTEHASLASLAKSSHLRRAATALGRDDGFFHPPLAINHAATDDNGFGSAQGACTACGSCCTGCPEGAKNTLDHNYLALAEKHGARVRTQCEVMSLEQSDAGYTLDCIDHLRGTSFALHAPKLFLCAGSVHSTRLLAGARLRSSAKQTQSRVGLGYFPGADAVGVVYDTASAQHPSWGPAITSAIFHTEPEIEGTPAVPADPDGARKPPPRYFMIQDGGYAEELGRLLGVLRAPIWVGRNRLSRARDIAVEPFANQPPVRAKSRLPVDDVLKSPLDRALDAAAAGYFHKAVPEALARAFPEFVAELARPLSLPAIVDRTLERSLRERFRSSPFFRLFAEDGYVFRCLRFLSLRSARLMLGSSDAIASQAMFALLEGGATSRTDRARDVFGFDDAGAERRLMLLAMGRDSHPGALVFDEESRRLVADLDLFYLTPTYSKEERLMTDIAEELGGELRVNPAWSFLGKPITVHSQGGCRMSESPRLGVVDPSGNVHGCPGLYVLDGSVLCRSVGVNPSATILAIAEHAVLEFIRREREPSWPEGDASEGAVEYRAQRLLAEEFVARGRARNWAFSPPLAQGPQVRSPPLSLEFDEWMHGFCAPVTSDPDENDDEYRRHETRGRPDHPIALSLTARASNLSCFFEDEQHRLQLRGSVTLRLPGAAVPETFSAFGELELFSRRHKPHGLEADEVRAAQDEISRAGTVAGGYSTVVGPAEADEECFLRYSLAFRDEQQRLWTLLGYKRIKDDPGFDVFRDTSGLFVKLLASEPTPVRECVVAAGVVHVDLNEFLTKQLPSFRVEPADDPARVSFALGKFMLFFFGSLRRVYLPEVSGVLATFFGRPPGERRERRRRSQRHS
jgi:choline dehydrogenase-like flavoprotein